MKNGKIIILFTLILSLGLFSPGIGQELPDKMVLDLQGAVDHALSFNKSLKNARMSSTRRSGSSRAAKCPPDGISVHRWRLHTFSTHPRTTLHWPVE